NLPKETTDGAGVSSRSQQDHRKWQYTFEIKNEVDHCDCWYAGSSFMTIFRLQVTYNRSVITKYL
ncbi:hypothetical protein KPH14_003277, partial [Odynerus spinipes]